MVDKTIMLDLPETIIPEASDLRQIQWCDGHWAELMFALRDRGLEGQIAQTTEELNAKFAAGELDPCWEAFNMINMAALEIFGPDKIVQENGGCPVCAFANIAQHVADLMHSKYGKLN